MNGIVECVPNFSEGRNNETINAIAGAVRAVPGVKLLNIEPDADYNRVVITFVGEPDPCADAAFRATQTAAALIDMRAHHGGHPRLGATDVCPFIPVRGVSTDDCVRLANVYGKRVAEELHIPVYLYGAAARTPERKLLSTIRKGEYEGLEHKLQDAQWKPDYGEAVFNAKSGATVAGVRTFLIAYNVNLSADDLAAANEIAQRIRESGRVKKGDDGATIKDEKGNAVRIPGSLKSVQAMGVRMERNKITQVSINILDYSITPIHTVFEEVKKEAHSLNMTVTGSEIVGLIPLDAILQAGRYYAERDGVATPDEHALIACAADALGLSQLEAFIPERKIIEYQILHNE